MARDVRARSLLDRATAWSPVLLLGGLAALTYWLDSQVQPPPPRRDGSERHDPDIYVEGFRAVELDDKGRPKQADRGQARAAFRRRPDHRVHRADALADAKPASPRSASPRDSGKLSGDRKDVYFTGNVRAVRDAGPDQAGRKPGRTR